MENNRFDQYYDMKESMGKKALNLPYDLRAKVYEADPVLYKAFTLGRVTPEQLQTVQKVYDSWFNDTHPTDSDMIQKRNESLLRDNIQNTDRKLKRTKAELQRMDSIIEADGHLPMGARNKLRDEIKALEEQLESYKSVQANTQEQPKSSDQESTQGEEDWMDSIL